MTNIIAGTGPDLPHPVREQDILFYAASAEKGSEHPLGEAIVKKAKEQNIELRDPSDFQAVPGHGIRAKIDGKNVLLGNEKFMNDENIDINFLSGKAEQLSEEGRTPMYVTVDGNAIGIVAVAMSFSSVSVVGNALRLRRARL